MCHTLHPFQWFSVYLFRVVQPCAQPNFDTLFSPQKEILHPFTVVPHFPQTSQPWETTNLLSISIDFSILTISYKQNRKCVWCFVNDFFHLPCFKFHPCYGIHHFIPFYFQMIYHCMDVSHFIYLFLYWWPLRLFLLFGY